MPTESTLSADEAMSHVRGSRQREIVAKPGNHDNLAMIIDPITCRLLVALFLERSKISASNHLLLMLSPKILWHALSLIHVGVLVVQVLSVLNILLSVGVGVRVVRVLNARQRGVSRRLPAAARHMRAAADAAILRAIGSRRLESVW